MKNKTYYTVGTIPNQIVERIDISNSERSLSWLDTGGIKPPLFVK